MFKEEQNKSYLSTGDMLKDLGYVTTVPKIGTLGKALMKLSNENPQCTWLKKHEDKMFKKLRQERKEKNNGN